MDKSRIANEQALEFVSEHQKIFLQNISNNLATFIESSFLKVLFDKSLSAPVDKAQLLTMMFGDSADLVNFTSQSQATNIQPTTLSLIFSIAFYVSSLSWDTFMHHFYAKFEDMGDNNDTDDEVDESSEDEIDTGDSDQMIVDLGKQTSNTVSDKPPVLPDKKMVSVDQTVTSETSQKKKQMCVSDDKQTKNQSTMTKPDAQTSINKPQQKGKKSSDIMTNYILIGSAHKCYLNFARFSERFVVNL
ncbi:hypothetical protein C1646_773064 [Rhizophagus diaphanus]|nr:hypothetical protein C1646_773064 [Rhizophagus diaphanus] [Rhizophagus sp. MUCL 43196]